MTINISLVALRARFGLAFRESNARCRKLGELIELDYDEICSIMERYYTYKGKGSGGFPPEGE